MKRKLLISINPVYVERILNGTKKYEYRTRAAKQDIDKVIIYETYPIKKVVAEAEIEKVISLPPEELWNETQEHSGISKEDYDLYFANRKVAYAYKLGKVVAYDEVKELNDYGISYPPQSYVYL